MASQFVGQWIKIEECREMLDDAGQQLLEQRLRRLYTQFEIPLEVRKSLASLLESVSGDDMNRSPDDLGAEGSELFNEIIQELQNQAKGKTFPNNSSLTETIEKFQKSYESNPVSLVHHVRSTLVQELEVISSLQNNQSDEESKRRLYQEQCTKVAEAMKLWKYQADQCERKIFDLTAATEQFMKLFEEVQSSETKGKSKRLSSRNGPNKTDVQKKQERQQELLHEQLKSDGQEVKKRKEECENLLVRICDLILEQVNNTSDCIGMYEKQQKLNILDINLGPPLGALADLNDMCEAVNEGVVQQSQLFDNMSEIYAFNFYPADQKRQMVQDKKAAFDEQLTKHLQRIIVIDNHPKQVLKVASGRNGKLAMSLRILGPCNLGLNVNLPVVKANLHAEKDIVKEMAVGKKVSAGDIAINNNTQDAKYERSKKQLIVSFSNANIKNLKRPADGRSREERVTELKYGVIFMVKLFAAGKEYTVKKLSLPIVLITQTSQEGAAKGTLMWDAVFSEDTRTGYQESARVLWKDLADLINMLYLKSTERGLTYENLNHLAQRVFGGTDDEDYSQREIEKSQVMKDNLEGTNFSLWKWIFACLNLIKQCLMKEWNRGLVMGFVSKEKVDEYLCDCDVGTFLLRFKGSGIYETQSALNTGVLVPAAVVEANGGKRVSHVDANLTQPQLAKKSLARWLQSYQVADSGHPNVKLSVFKTLYPQMPFEETFGGLIETEELGNRGYDRITHKVELNLADLHISMNGSVPPSPAASRTDTYSEAPSSPGQMDIMEQARIMNEIFPGNGQNMETDGIIWPGGDLSVEVEMTLPNEADGFDLSTVTALLCDDDIPFETQEISSEYNIQQL